ncbi:TIGR02587 family membrane protein [Aestuariibacter halophilus]|uniref:TIGR02587 family membrane protein n=1 Tax=Fluctibacter halophilus TaxID=226011 RepID=A0ABS8GAX2_9ALTE|nr:DUF2391 family protein [Aestuariibacter halophilus]MCC2617584.1 TIGR02587 family membrane protein [Aestuariibacter halophilus]
MNLFFNTEDASQIAIGAFAMALPIAFSQEAWDMAVRLPTINLILLVLLSLVFVAHYAYFSLFQGAVEYRWGSFVLRIVIAYGITLVVVACVLFCLDKLPLLEEPVVALRRAVIIAMPASLGAIIVDSLDKE